VGVWVYSKTASRVSAAIRLDNGTISTGDTHSGNGWERLTHTLVADGVSSSIKVGISVPSGTAFVFYADQVIATAGQSELPSSIGTPIMGWREETDNIVLHGIRGADNMNLRVRGMAPLSELSTGASTMEIEGDQLRFLFAQAAMLWFQQDIDQLDDTEFQIAQRRFGHFRNMVATSKGRMAPITLLKGVY